MHPFFKGKIQRTSIWCGLVLIHNRNHASIWSSSFKFWSFVISACEHYMIIHPKSSKIKWCIQDIAFITFDIFKGKVTKAIHCSLKNYTFENITKTLSLFDIHKYYILLALIFLTAMTTYKMPVIQTNITYNIP